MGDTGVSQHTLDIALGDRHDVTQEHRQGGNPPQNRCEIYCQGRQGAHENAHQGCEPPCFGPHRHEGCHRGRRALVYIRGPHVEGDCRYLEPQADQDQRRTDAEQGQVSRTSVEGFDDLCQPGAASRAEDQCHSVDHEAARESAQHEIFDRRFL